ncbi:MAG: protein translocase subunit SecF [Nanoarchaeota archaeon]|jgi:preprotein translocase subunit SecF|nr:protein translocase subunit SecF [Nanoarchaeota archaeon]
METKNWHDRNYKKLLLIPAILIVFSAIFLINFTANNGDFVLKDVSLTGGTAVTVFNQVGDQVDIATLETDLSGKLEDMDIRELYSVTTGEQKGFEVKTKSNLDLTKQVLEEYLGYELVDSVNANIITTGSSFSEGFYRQLLIAILIAFIFMAIVVFILFRTAIPSTAVIISAFADILMTLVVFNIIGMKMSTAGIIGFLMLIGYSVDTDILLTTRMLKRTDGTLNSRILSSMKTGMTMTLTSFFAFLFALFVVRSFSAELTQIFTILVVGLAFDLLNTWVTNVSILKWYVGAKKK